jgi:cytochrome-b5 reductase
MFAFSWIISGTDKEGEETFRSYTPVSRVDAEGYFDILLKVYFPTERFPDGGVVSQYLNKLDVGSKVKIAGPNGRLIYETNGVIRFLRENVTKKYKKFSFIGGGSGITPLYQVIQHLLDEKHLNFDLRLLFANKTEADILIRDRLDDLANQNLVKVAYSLDFPTENWTGLKGFVSDEMVRQFFNKASEDHLVLICGPPPMTKSLTEIFKKEGHDASNVYVF